jgi:glutathione S-transferase
VRFFIDAVSNKFFSSVAALFSRGEAPDEFIAAAAEVQELLAPGGFAVGDHFTIADAALAMFFGRWELQLCHDVGKYAEGTGPRVRGAVPERALFAPAKVLCKCYEPPELQE